MLNSKCQHRCKIFGFSLIELTLVLAIAATLAFIGINRYQQYKLNADIETVKQNVNLIFNAANTFYMQYCRTGTPFTISMKDLKSKNLLPDLPKSKLLTDLGNGYQFEVAASEKQTITDPNTKIEKDFYALTITAIPKVPTNARSLYQQLLGTSLSVNTFGAYLWQWTRLPTYSVPTMSSQLWIMRSSLDYFKQSVSTKSILTEPTDTSCAFQ